MTIKCECVHCYEYWNGLPRSKKRSEKLKQLHKVKLNEARIELHSLGIGRYPSTRAKQIWVNIDSFEEITDDLFIKYWLYIIHEQDKNPHSVSPGFCNRTLHWHIMKSRYGERSSILFEIEGTPIQGTLYCAFQHDLTKMDIILTYKESPKISLHSEKGVLINKLVQKFLSTREHLI